MDSFLVYFSLSEMSGVLSKATRLIFKAGASLSVFPYRGRAIDGTQQRKLQVPFGKYGYVLYYRIEDNRVFILRVHHGRENRM